MNRLVLLCIILLILTINITGCDLSSPLSQAPSPVPKEQESIIIEPIEPPAEIVLGQEKSFNIRPPQTIDKNSAGLNMDIVDGPKVSCASSSVDRWTLICEGIQEGVDVVKIIVTAPDGTVIDGKRDVTILPPPPTDTPTPTPTEEPTDTPTPTEEPSPTASPPAAGDILPVADFNNCGSPNNLGGEIGTANPEGISIDEYIVEEGRGCVAKLGYEIKEWAGLYLKLEGLNASNYDTLTFDAKGEADPSTWPQSFKIELKRNNNSETSIVRHFEISDTWQKYGVSLSDFTGSLSGWDNLSELVFVFEKEHSGPKGILYLDDIALTSASISTDTPPPTPTNTSTLTPTETTVQVATPIGRCPFAEGPRRPPLESSTSDIGVEFEVPQHCDTGVETSMEIGGIFTSELTNQEIWILVYPTDSEYYPQTLNSCEQIPSEASGGLWRTWANFGGPPQQYDLVAVVTTLDGEASQEFKRWLAEGCATGDYPGYLRENLPNGLTEVGAITISTKSPEESSVQPAAIASPASEPCDDDASRYGFCSGAMGWVPQGNAPGVQAVNAVAQSLDQAQSGQASLKLSVDLIGGNHGSHSGGETFVDMFRNLPAGMTTFGPYDFNGVTITCWVYTPPGSAGDPGSPNGLQVFVKDASEDFRSEYGTWENITPEREGRWFPIALTVSPETPRDGYKDEGFDPTRIALLGVKIGAGGQSTDAVRYTGPIYVDACDW